MLLMMMMTDERLRPLGSTRDWGSQTLLLRGLTGLVRIGQWRFMDQKSMMFKGRVCLPRVCAGVVRDDR